VDWGRFVHLESDELPSLGRWIHELRFTSTLFGSDTTCRVDARFLDRCLAHLPSIRTLHLSLCVITHFDHLRSSNKTEPPLFKDLVLDYVYGESPSALTHILAVLPSVARIGIHGLHIFQDTFIFRQLRMESISGNLSPLTHSTLELE